jgi:Tetratricopeptide repeat
MGMKWQILTGGIFSFVLVGLAVPGWAETSTEGVNFIVQLSGDVRLKRSGWSGYQKVSAYASLGGEDRLQLGAKASATVLCSNFKRWEVPSGKVSRIAEGCPPGVATLVSANRILTPTRSSNDIPYVLSPRHTAILTPLPLLQWHPVPGVKRYIVEVRGMGIRWEVQTVRAELVYAGSPLKPGSYKVLVTADNGVFLRSDKPISFRLLSDREVEQIKVEVENLQNQLLNGEAKTIALAYLYGGHNLNALAIETLEGLVQQGGNPTASVYQLLGEIYQRIGLPDLARERFSTALAKVEDNLDGQARIQASLGEIDTILNRLDEARRWYRQAQASYRALGDEARVKELQQKLDAL